MSNLGVAQIPSTGAISSNGHRGTVPNALTREARLYAIKELVRRAGVSHDTFRSWKIDIGSDWTTLSVLPGTQKQIRLHHAPSAIWSDLLRGCFNTVHFHWLGSVPRLFFADLVVPFVHPSQAHRGPLFRLRDSDTIECNVDLALSSVLTLSRWEERLVTQLDQHGRVPATASVSLRDRFLMRPIVDEYGVALEQALCALIPNWQPAPRELRVNISHDIDNVGLPFNIRTAIGHTIRRRYPRGTVQDLVSWLPGLNPVYLDDVREIASLSLNRGLQPTVYWKGASRPRTPICYNPNHPKIRAIVSWLSRCQIEMGVHPGYDTYHAPDRLRREVQVVRDLLALHTLGGRQDYLRWSPSTWIDWENCGLAYDSSVGFADHVGFRAGTCFPYRPWLFTLNREARLLELPLIVMDVTLSGYMNLAPREGFAAARQCIERCRAVGGVFALLWHNDNIHNPKLAVLFPAILDSLVGSKKCDLLNPPADCY
jgi:hypothetical protein